jgi:hypothetical protein
MYRFLLKGHEDLRQDERVMQLFGLVNALLSNDPETSKRDLLIKFDRCFVFCYCSLVRIKCLLFAVGLQSLLCDTAEPRSWCGRLGARV